MPEPDLSESQKELLASLYAGLNTSVLALPYTPQFEQLYSDVIDRSNAAASRHTVWEALVSGRLLNKASPAVGAVDVRPFVASAADDAAFEGDTTNGQQSLFDLQPWDLAPEPRLPSPSEVERQALLRAISESALGTMERRIAYVLQRYPETRDSDTALAIRYWRMFQSQILEQWDPLSLDVLYELDRIGTISRVRRHIQNDLRLFSASARTRQLRGEFQMDFHDYLLAGRSVGSEIRFYLDETGNETNQAYTGVAGLCVMEWRQYEKHWAALSHWRSEQVWPETIHFVETGSAQQPKALALMDQLKRRRAGLLFVGYALPSRGSTHQVLVDLFIQLVIDSLHHMRGLGCLGGQRALTVIKEADTGFDAIHLNPLRQYLAQQVGREFPDQVFLKSIEAIPKGREVLLECADLVAGAMQRRALYGGRNPKDVLAEAMFNVTGFEDVRDNGAVFKAYPEVGY